MWHILGYTLVERWMFLDSIPEIWKCCHDVVLWKEYVLWRKADHIWKFFLWLCDLNIFFNLLDSQFSHLQNGRYNIFFKGMLWELNEVVTHRKCLLFILLSCEWEKFKWCVKKKKRHGLQTTLRLNARKFTISLPFTLSPSPPSSFMFLSPFPLPYCLKCIFCMGGKFLFLSFR